MTDVSYGKNVNDLLMSVRVWAAGTSAAQATARMGQFGRIGRIGRIEKIGGIGIIRRFGGLSGGAGGWWVRGGFSFRGISKRDLRWGETGRRAVISGS